MDVFDGPGGGDTTKIDIGAVDEQLGTIKEDVGDLEDI